MEHRIGELAERWLRKNPKDLTDSEHQVLRHIAERKRITRHVGQALREQQTVGQRVADRVASFGGSWTFIFIFGAVLFTWILANSLILIAGHHPFDPYPFILLNLVLSMLAAIQAPVIMMSQNRQAAKDRIQANHDYEINLKAEVEIMTLDEKLDDLRERRWAELIAIQADQIKMLKDLIERKMGDPPGSSPSAAPGAEKS
jgi:uncharacterized membrane protein